MTQFSDVRTLFAMTDHSLAYVVGVLALAGLVIMASASLQIAEANTGSAYFFISRHTLYLVMAILLGLVIFAFISMTLLQKLAIWILLIAVIGLVLVQIPGLGREVNGSLRWINVFSFTIQPSEPAKLAFVCFLAWHVARHTPEQRLDWRFWRVPAAVFMVLSSLLLVQPDYGSVVVLALTAMGMLFLAGACPKHFFVIAILGLLVMGLLVITQEYRVARLMFFLDPWQDQFGDGYQLTQSLIAFGRGHLSGVGLGNSVQKLFYLPEAHTDFVFAVWAEELGLVGNLVLVGLFTLLCVRIFMAGAGLSRDGHLFAGQLALGIGFILAAQIFINLGVNMGLLPTKGLTLPFVSYGGSSLLVSVAMTALVLRAVAEFRGAALPRRRRS